MRYKALYTLKPHKSKRKDIPAFKHWWIFKGQVFKTKEIDGSVFIVGHLGNLICRVNSMYQQQFFVEC